jgi:hypothetical protein
VKITTRDRGARALGERLRGVKRTRAGWIFDDGGIAQLRIVNPPIVAGSNGKAVDGMTNAERLAYVRELIASLPPGVQS